MTDEEKRRICRLVAGLVTSDEDFDDSERAFMDKMLRGFGIPEEEWDAVFPLIDTDEAAQEMAELPADVQTEALELLIGAALADGQVTDEEAEFLMIVGSGMGLSSDDVEARIAAHA